MSRARAAAIMEHRVRVEFPVVVFAHHRDPAPRLDRLDRHRVVRRRQCRAEQRRLVDPHEQVHMPVHMPERREVLHQRDPAAALPHTLEHILDLVTLGRIGRERLDPHRRAEHEVHHRRHAPPDVVLDHHLAPTAVRIKRIQPPPRHPVREPRFLRRAVPHPAIDPSAPDRFERVPEIRPQPLEPRHIPRRVRRDQ